MTAETRIKQFLGDHPNGVLYVAVGFASVWGLDWLNDHTQGRRVKLLVGNAQYRYFKNASDSERAGAVAFLDRGDVDLLNWYKKHGGRSEAHLKGWLIWDGTDTGEEWHLLAGSANLTQKGLRNNKELMVETSGDDLFTAVEKFEQLYNQAWDRKDILKEYIANPDGFQGYQQKKTGTQTAKKQTAPTKQQPETASAPAGCMAALAFAFAVCIVAAATVLIAL